MTPHLAIDIRLALSRQLTERNAQARDGPAIGRWLDLEGGALAIKIAKPVTGVCDAVPGRFRCASVDTRAVVRHGHLEHICVTSSGDGYLARLGSPGNSMAQRVLD